MKPWFGQASLSKSFTAPAGISNVSPCHMKAVNELDMQYGSSELMLLLGLFLSRLLTLCQPISLNLFFVTFPPSTSEIICAPKQPVSYTHLTLPTKRIV